MIVIDLMVITYHLLFLKHNKIENARVYFFLRRILGSLNYRISQIRKPKKIMR